MIEGSQKDFLTGFFLRDAFQKVLENIIFESKANKKPFSIALIDLDRFKKINDKFGHPFGDEILRYAGSIFRLTFPADKCYIFRYGGDEFIAVFPDKEPKAALRLLRQCNYNILHRQFLFQNKFYKVTISCGIAGFPLDAQTPEELIKKADKALYFSKRHGRGRTTVANSINYLRVVNAFLFIISLCIILISFLILYQLNFTKVIQPALGLIKNARIITKPKNLDIIILKNGVVFEGHIVEETEDKVTLSLSLDQGEGTSVFNKSEIAKIKYSSKEYPKKDFNKPATPKKNSPPNQPSP